MKEMFISFCFILFFLVSCDDIADKRQSSELAFPFEMVHVNAYEDHSYEIILEWQEYVNKPITFVFNMLIELENERNEIALRFINSREHSFLMEHESNADGFNRNTPSFSEFGETYIIDDLNEHVRLKKMESLSNNPESFWIYVNSENARSSKPSLSLIIDYAIWNGDTIYNKTPMEFYVDNNQWSLEEFKK